MVNALSRVLKLPISEVEKILQNYGRTRAKKIVSTPKISISPFKFPKPYGKLNEQGKAYLTKRKFDPEYLEREWGIRQTGPVSLLDGISYGNRILIPIRWNRKTVSFQTRDITSKSDRKYLACPMRREVMHHKNIVYGKQAGWLEEPLIVVEGVTDVWRLGKHAVATFGTSFKMEQVLLLSKIAEKFVILFDGEPHAQEQAKKLAIKLKVLGKKVVVETVEGDPGDMEQKDADYLVKQFRKGYGK